MSAAYCLKRRRRQTIAGLLGCGALLAPVGAAPLLPDAGTILQESRRPPLAAPQKPPAPAIVIDEPRADDSVDDTRPIAVSRWRFADGLPPQVSEAELQALLAPELGRSHTLKGLVGIAGRVTRHLRERGALLAFAYVPAQQIDDGVVTIAVVAGRYGKVSVSGKTCQRDDLVPGTFSALRSGEIIDAETLERALLLANDIPGVQVEAALAPGDAGGTADLSVNATTRERVSGVVYADNAGISSTGQARAGAQITVNGLLGTGDSLAIGGLSSFKGLNNYDVSYGTLIGTQGLKFTLREAKTDYSLGDDFAALDATGTARIDSAELSYPLIRRRDANLTLSAGYDHKKLTDDVDSVSSHVGKTARLWRFGASGNFNDTLAGAASNDLSLTYSHGELAIDEDDALASDASSAQTAGNFAKLNVAYRREQTLTTDLQLNLSFAAQQASKNLDSSEKFYLGGPGGVRAYPQSEAPGDQGYRATLELRWKMAPLRSAKDSVFLSTFADYGAVQANKNPWPGSGENDRQLAGAGVGVLWQIEKKAALRADLAWKIGSEVATADTDKSPRLWLQGAFYF